MTARPHVKHIEKRVIFGEQGMSGRITSSMDHEERRRSTCLILPRSVTAATHGNNVSLAYPAKLVMLSISSSSRTTSPTALTYQQRSTIVASGPVVISQFPLCFAWQVSRWKRSRWHGSTALSHSNNVIPARQHSTTREDLLRPLDDGNYTSPRDCHTNST